MTETNPNRRESTLAKIRALMAKTVANGSTEAEAALAAAKVDELMATYEIDLDEVTMRQQDIVQSMVDDGWLHPVGKAARAIAQFTDCRYWINDNTRLVYFGFQVDTEIAEYLTLLFKRAIDRESTAFLLFNADYDAANKAGKREMQRSFGIGMAERLGERLRDLKSKRDFTAREAGRSLVVLKMPAVDEAMGKLNMQWGRAAAMVVAKNAVARNAGMAAAAHVAINAGVASRAARQGGRLS